MVMMMEQRLGLPLDVTMVEELVLQKADVWDILKAPPTDITLGP